MNLTKIFLSAVPGFTVNALTAPKADSSVGPEILAGMAAGAVVGAAGYEFLESYLSWNGQPRWLEYAERSLCAFVGGLVGGVLMTPK